MGDGAGGGRQGGNPLGALAEKVEKVEKVDYLGGKSGRRRGGKSGRKEKWKWQQDNILIKKE